MSSNLKKMFTDLEVGDAVQAPHTTGEIRTLVVTNTRQEWKQFAICTQGRNKDIFIGENYLYRWDDSTNSPMNTRSETMMYDWGKATLIKAFLNDKKILSDLANYFVLDDLEFLKEPHLQRGKKDRVNLAICSGTQDVVRVLTLLSLHDIELSQELKTELSLLLFLINSSPPTTNGDLFFPVID